MGVGNFGSFPERQLRNPRRRTDRFRSDPGDECPATTGEDLDAWIAVLMGPAWVLGSYVLIFIAPFSTGGKWVVGAVAELVLLFAVLQFVGIRRIQKSEQTG